MVDLMVLESNNDNTSSLGGLNGIRGRCVGGNDNAFGSPPHHKLSFPFIFLVIFLSAEPPHVHNNRTI